MKIASSMDYDLTTKSTLQPILVAINNDTIIIMKRQLSTMKKTSIENCKIYCVQCTAISYGIPHWHHNILTCHNISADCSTAGMMCSAVDNLETKYYIIIIN